MRIVENYHGISVMTVIIVEEIDENYCDFGMILNEIFEETLKRLDCVYHNNSQSINIVVEVNVNYKNSVMILITMNCSFVVGLWD